MVVNDAVKLCFENLENKLDFYFGYHLTYVCISLLVTVDNLFKINTV